MTRSFAYALRRLWPLIQAALYIPFLLVVGGEVFKGVLSTVDPFTGFRPISVSVPNHCSGENPIVHVTRFARANVLGSYYIRIEPVTGGASMQAYQSNWFNYKPRSDVFFVTDLFQYFNGGMAFSLKPGRYFGEVQWTFKRSWRTDAVVTIKTFPFEVWPQSDPRCAKG